MTTAYRFKTHTSFIATAKPEFVGCTELSPSGSMQRWLSTSEDAIIRMTTGTDPDPQTIPVTLGSIALCEPDTGGWVVSVPVARMAFRGEFVDDMPELVSRGRATGPKGRAS